MKKTKLVSHLDQYIDINCIRDSSLNGLQVDGAAEVKRVAVGVDANLKTIQVAARWGANMLITHHGLFWSRNERITGVMYKRVAALVDAKMSLYAAHLPLDLHEEVGNNVEIVRLLDFKRGPKFANYHGVDIGYIADAQPPLTVKQLAARVEKALGAKPQVLPFGPAKIRRIGVISGGAADYAAAAKELGCDAFVTGETSHVAYSLAKEAGIHVIYAGHYASETVGVKALARHLKSRFDIETRFVPAPTGY